MTYIRDTSDALRWLAFESYREELKELRLTMRNVETKAQANIALAGIFLAAAVAYMEKLSLNPNPMEKFMLASGVLLLGLSVALSLLVLRIGDLTEPPSGRFINMYVTPMLARDTERGAREVLQMGFTQAVKQWEAAIKRTRELNGEKAQRLSESQGILLASVAIFALLTITKVITLGGVTE